jgi:hypothetical protein
MSMIDNMLEGDEPILKAIAMEDGPLAADQYLVEFNNACSQFAGFEQFYTLVVSGQVQVNGFFAPRASLSRHQEH